VPLRIRQYKGGRYSDEIWSGTLIDAQDAYCQPVRDGTLDRMEILNSSNELMFRYPLETQLVDAAA
jgi:hypothetical protein